MIQEIQQAHLKLIRAYSFSKLIIEWLPQVQDAIRESVLRDLKDWFSIIKDGAYKIGKLAVELTFLRQEKAVEIMDTPQTMQTGSRNLNLATSMEIAMNEEYNLDEIEADDSQIDFTPLFQCIHIHEVLNKRVQLKLEFDESRRLQAEVILHSAIPSLKNDDRNGIERYIHEIAGFFVIEATVISTTQDFRSRSSVETLWQTATNKMNAHLFEALTECTNPDLYLKIKLLVTSFIQTMELYGYAVSSLTDLMVSLLDRYAELMKNKCTALILKTIDEEDDYTSMIVQDNDELEEILSVYTIPEDLLKQGLSKRDTSIIFPKVLPFSRGVPQSCKYIRELVYGFYKFAEGFSQQNYEIDDLLKKTIENLLLTVNSLFRDRIGSAGLSVVYQMTINVQYFGKACTDFEDLLMERRYSARTIRITLLSAKVFTETKLIAEQRMYSIINAQSDNFLELVDYDWNGTMPRRQASPFLSDLISYLSTVMTTTLADLPNKTKGLIYFEAFDHLATAMKAMILNPSISRISLSALETIEYDVCYLENACKKLQESHAQDSFAEIKQVSMFDIVGCICQIRKI
jgi:exocyst complex component 6